MHPDNPRLGYWTVATIYISLSLFTFFAPFLVSLTGTKYGMFLGSVTYVTFVLANIWPSWPMMITAAALLGLGAAVLWTAQGAYLTLLARRGANGLSVDDSIGQMQGIFWSFFQVATVLGNLSTSLIKGKALFYTFVALAGLGCASLIFQPSIPDETEEEKLASANPSSPASATAHDGLAAGGLDANSGGAKAGPMGSRSDEAAAALVPKPQSGRRSVRRLIMATLSLCLDPSMALFIPVINLSGLVIGFLVTTFNLDVITASVGKDKIGFMMALCFFADALWSVLAGPLAGKIGRHGVIAIGGAAQITFAVVLLFKRDTSGYELIIPCVLLVGIGDATWNTQLNSLLGVLFPADLEAAFACFKLWASIGFALPCILGPYLAFKTKAIIVLCNGILGMICFFFLFKRRRSSFLA